MGGVLVCECEAVTGERAWQRRNSAKREGKGSHSQGLSQRNTGEDRFFPPLLLCDLF